MSLKPRNENPEGMMRSDTTRNFVIDETNCSLDKFKWFIEERQSIRDKKERGLPRPWTTDEVMDKTRFTNIYRQDDKVSKFIYSKVRGLPGDLLVFNLIMSRLTNRIDVLNKFLPCHPMTNLDFLLDGEAILMNAGAYQVSPGMVKLDDYDTNREIIVHYPKKVYKQVYDAITSTTDIEEAVKLGNTAFGGTIPFVMLQIVLDYQYLTWHYDENSDVPVGQGAKPVVDVLGGLDYLSKELCMTKYDVEHACCEFRKYLYRQDKNLSRYSYKPNSMGIS